MSRKPNVAPRGADEQSGRGEGEQQGRQPEMSRGRKRDIGRTTVEVARVDVRRELRKFKEELRENEIEERGNEMGFFEAMRLSREYRKVQKWRRAARRERDKRAYLERKHDLLDKKAKADLERAEAIFGDADKKLANLDVSIRILREAVLEVKQGGEADQKQRRAEKKTRREKGARPERKAEAGRRAEEAGRAAQAIRKGAVGMALASGLIATLFFGADLGQKQQAERQAQWRGNVEAVATAGVETGEEDGGDLVDMVPVEEDWGFVSEDEVAEDGQYEPVIFGEVKPEEVVPSGVGIVDYSGSGGIEGAGDYMPEDYQIDWTTVDTPVVWSEE